MTLNNQHSYQSPEVETMDIKPVAVLCASPGYGGAINDIFTDEDEGGAFR